MVAVRLGEATPTIGAMRKGSRRLCDGDVLQKGEAARFDGEKKSLEVAYIGGDRRHEEGGFLHRILT
jgi:hypothetical protein